MIVFCFFASVAVSQPNVANPLDEERPSNILKNPKIKSSFKENIPTKSPLQDKDIETTSFQDKEITPTSLQDKDIAQTSFQDKDQINKTISLNNHLNNNSNTSLNQRVSFLKLFFSFILSVDFLIYLPLFLLSVSLYAMIFELLCYEKINFSLVKIFFNMIGLGDVYQNTLNSFGESIFHFLTDDNTNLDKKYPLFLSVLIPIVVLFVVLIDYFILSPIMKYIISKYFKKQIQNSIDRLYFGLNNGISLEQLNSFIQKTTEGIVELSYLFYCKLAFILVLGLCNLYIDKKIYYENQQKTFSLSFLNFFLNIFEYIKFKSGLTNTPKINNMKDILLKAIEIKDNTNTQNVLQKEHGMILFVLKLLMSFYLIVTISLFLILVFADKNREKNQFIEHSKEIIRTYDVYYSCNLNLNSLKKEQKKFLRFLDWIELVRDIFLITSIIIFAKTIFSINESSSLYGYLGKVISNFGFSFALFALIPYFNNMKKSIESLYESVSVFNIVPCSKRTSFYDIKSKVNGIYLHSGMGIGYNGIQIATLTSNISFEKGSIVNVIGPSGSGKTTLLNAMHRTIKLITGRIKIKFQDDSTFYLDTLSKTSLYAQIGYCPQFFDIKQITLKDLLLKNNKLNEEDLKEEEGEWLIDFVCLGKWFRSLPAKWNTMLVDLGSLSGGQRNLLRLAVELSKLFVKEKKKLVPFNKEDPKYKSIKKSLNFCEKVDGMMMDKRYKYSFEGFLVLDESLDNVDYKTRMIILYRLWRYVLAKKLGIIIITHQRKTLESFPYTSVFIGNGKCFIESYNLGTIFEEMKKR